MMTEVKSEREASLRLRLNLNTSQLCFRHLQGKTNKEVRAWVEMALNFVAVQLDAAASGALDAGKAPAPSLPKPTVSVTTKTLKPIGSLAGYSDSAGEAW